MEFGKEYIKTFDTEAQYLVFKASSGYVEPNVSYTAENDKVHYNPIDWSTKYLTFFASESGTFKFSGNSINYSLDSGTTWTALASDTSTPTVESGHTIMWKATGLTPTSNGIGKFISTGNFTVKGNVMSLYYGDDFVGQTSLSGKGYAFKNLFNGCNKMTSAKNLSLPATTLADNCYYNMFSNCTNLTTAPELPATTLADNCYYYMFYGCTSLTTAPKLPATTLASSCYYYMFASCRSLTTAPKLPATTLASSCYYYMFYGCTRLTTAPELPATTLASGCYSNMFNGCTSLTTAPVLPATTLVSTCYASMFTGCTHLNYIKAMFTTTPSSSYMSNWVSGVASSGTFVKNSAATWTSSCGSSTYPCNWTIKTASS